MRRSLLVAALCVVCLAACGERHETPPDGLPLSQAQRAAAQKANLPVSFENQYEMRFVLVPAGTFRMGSPEDEAGRETWEDPHDVTISQPFYVQTTEVTNAQYRRWRKNHDAGTYIGIGGDKAEHSLRGDTQPALPIRHDDAKRFASWLNAQDGNHHYRLPTEAEWEYACRAGTTTAFSFGDDRALSPKYASFSDRHDPTGAEEDELDDGYAVTAPVGSYLPNAWGLYDMHGNVWEWTTDRYAEYPTGPTTDPVGPDKKDDEDERRDQGFGPYFVCRGGSWRLRLDRMRCAMRGYYSFEAQMIHNGFRLVATMTPPPPKPPKPPPAEKVPTVRISTHDLSAMPDFDGFRRLTKSLAALDAILSPEWQFRYYSFDATWGEHEMLASMRDGSGDKWFAIISLSGIALQGLAHESPSFEAGKPKPWVFKDLPTAFRENMRNEEAADAGNTSFCVWRLLNDVAWQCGITADQKVNDGSEDLLSILNGDPRAYVDWASEYYEAEIRIEDVAAIYAHKPITKELAARLNAEADFAAIQHELNDIGYPDTK